MYISHIALKGGHHMCWCDIVSKAKIGSLKNLGNGMEHSLRFLAEMVVGLSCLRVIINWVFGI